LGQPSVLGELITGILLGPTLLNLFQLFPFTDPHITENISNLAEIGVLLLMFLAGIEIHFEDLLKSGKTSALVGTFGVILPMVLGCGLGLLFSMEIKTAIFIGLILAATSVSISAQTLMELNVIKSRVGLVLMGAAVFDDILVILGLSIFTALTTSGSSAGLWDILWITIQMILFLVLASLIGWWIFPKVSDLIYNHSISQGLIAFVFVTILLYGWFAEEAGHMAAITGAFLAGLWFSRTELKEKIRHGISIIAYGLFVPIFFINIGLSANLRGLSVDNLIFLALLVIIAVISKVIGAGSGAKISGFSFKESLQLGVGMMSRGEVGLIVATVGVNQKIIHPEVLSAVVGVVIITTILTPISLRFLFPNKTRVQAVNQEKEKL
jgi:Kef-type K+ transport system membrane component KefB